MKNEYGIFNIYGKEIFIGYNSKRDVCRRVKIDGIKTHYVVTITGNVYNTDTKSKLTPAYIRNYPKVLIYYVDKNGNHTRKQIGIHKLVAKAFIPNPKNKPEVHHKDVNPRNNNVSNLMWVTNKEHNKIHQKLGKFTKSARVGDSSNFANTSTETVLKICEEFQKNELTPSQIAKKYGVSRKSVTLLLHKKRWKHITKDKDFSMYTKLRSVDAEKKKEAIRLLKENKLSLLDISKTTGITYTYLSHINRSMNLRKKK